MPMNTSGFSSTNRATSWRRKANRRAIWLMTSNKPMIDSWPESHQQSMPAAFINGPPIPAKRVSGFLIRMARISAAPSWSPDASPATRAMIISE